MDFKRSKIQQFLSTEKKTIFIQIGTTLLSMLTKSHTKTIMSYNRSTWVNGNVVCRSLNYSILPITQSTWICTLESCLDVSTSPLESCSFPFVKLGILYVATRPLNSSFILKPRSASIQSRMETLLKKTDSFVICLSGTLPPHPPKNLCYKNVMAPAGVIPIKYIEVLLCL